MSLTQDIAATWRGPGRVVARLMTLEARESRALYFLMMASILLFVARAPTEARMAALDPEGPPLPARLFFSALGILAFVPMLAYGFAALSHGVARLLGAGQGGFSGARLALFWALLAISPLTLLMGLVAGLVGQGMELSLLLYAWLGVFAWFWIGGLRATNAVGQAA
ncbi:YIP1 family protein [Mesobacterium pallidum]|uniref:YIP1 family protein n=1 Tax=Mesobacterium pallidum TaxID=2872037 RepID=UPI001EE383DA|nr:YIP1 family protein [Mesobacterium pallidum]